MILITKEDFNLEEEFKKIHSKRNGAYSFFLGTVRQDIDENIDGIWYFGHEHSQKSIVKKNSISNLKRFWCPDEKNIDWFSNNNQFLNEFLYQSTQIKNIWIPYGE